MYELWDIQALDGLVLSVKITAYDDDNSTNDDYGSESFAEGQNRSSTEDNSYFNSNGTSDNGSGDAEEQNSHSSENNFFFSDNVGDNISRNFAEEEDGLSGAYFYYGNDVETFSRNTWQRVDDIILSHVFKSESSSFKIIFTSDESSTSDGIFITMIAIPIESHGKWHGWVQEQFKLIEYIKSFNYFVLSLNLKCRPSQSNFMNNITKERQSVMLSLRFINQQASLA